MGKGRSPWQDGRRAWERLNGWHQDRPAAQPGHSDNGDDALTALSDIGLVRRLLDQAELVAVRTARRHNKSWAEIATKLGVARQSAWEKWRELDEPAAAPPPPQEDVTSEVQRRAADELAARAHRRRSTVVVPNVIGMSFADARQELLRHGLVAASPDPDGPSLTAEAWPQDVVTDQSPESGAVVPRESAVRLWLDRGGGSGVREPRRPKPEPRSGRAMNYDVSDAATG